MVQVDIHEPSQIWIDEMNRIKNKELFVKLHHEPEVLDYLVSLSPDDRKILQGVTKWSKSLLSFMAKDSPMIETMSKLSADDMADFKTMVGWSTPMITNTAKAKANPFAFFLKLSDDELESFNMMADWSMAALKRLRDEPHHLIVMHRMWEAVPDMDAFLKTYFMAHDKLEYDTDVILDAFSRGQIDSKLWLCDTVENLGLTLGRTWILCGWLGTLGYFMLDRKERLGIEHIRSFDIDPRCHGMADTMNRRSVTDGWKFKATTLDVNDLRYDNFAYKTQKYNGDIETLTESADTIINTSCDHMDRDAWWNSIPSGRLVILQDNNFEGHPDHINTVRSADEFALRYPMSTLLFKGELECNMYTRYMLIGRK